MLNLRCLLTTRPCLFNLEKYGLTRTLVYGPYRLQIHPHSPLSVL